MVWENTESETRLFEIRQKVQSSNLTSSHNFNFALIYFVFFGFARILKTLNDQFLSNLKNFLMYFSEFHLAEFRFSEFTPPG